MIILIMMFILNSTLHFCHIDRYVGISFRISLVCFERELKNPKLKTECLAPLSEVLFCLWSGTKICFGDFSHKSCLYTDQSGLICAAQVIIFCSLTLASCLVIQTELKQIIVKRPITFSRAVQTLLTPQAFLLLGGKASLSTKSEIRKPRCKGNPEQICSKATFLVLSRLYCFIDENSYAFFPFEQFHCVTPLFTGLQNHMLLQLFNLRRTFPAKNPQDGKISVLLQGASFSYVQGQTD